ncbi:inositol monophosphatase family protein [Streptosporangium saharense]|uniref:inositol monophosphatase family protein n=1 Tax=Streptosporangium saharense TaxID=1706840 RepID=UPI0036D064A0
MSAERTLHGVNTSKVSPDDAEVAAAAAWAGADVVRGLYGRRLARVDKGGGDFATTADVEAERAILGVLRAARPGDAVLGEEGGQRGAVCRAAGCVVTGIDGAPIGQAGRGLVVAADAETHGSLMSIIRGCGRT